MKATIFITATLEDENYLNVILKDLEYIKRSNEDSYHLDIFHRNFILPGQVVDSEVLSFLDSCDLILLLLSRDFLTMSSNGTIATEFQKAIDKHKKKEAVVVPIILRPCYWDDSFFNVLSALPKNGLPISKWKDQDDAFLNIYRGIKNVLEEIITKKNNDLNQGNIFRINQKTNPKKNDNKDTLFYINSLFPFNRAF